MFNISILLLSFLLLYSIFLLDLYTSIEALEINSILLLVLLLLLALLLLL
jgi:hypothetical protein